MQGTIIQSTMGGLVSGAASCIGSSIAKKLAHRRQRRRSSGDQNENHVTQDSRGGVQAAIASAIYGFKADKHFYDGATCQDEIVDFTKEERNELKERFGEWESGGYYAGLCSITQ